MKQSFEIFVKAKITFLKLLYTCSVCVYVRPVHIATHCEHRQIHPRFLHLLHYKKYSLQNFPNKWKIDDLNRSMSRPRCKKHSTLSNYNNVYILDKILEGYLDPSTDIVIALMSNWCQYLKVLSRPW